MYRYKNRKEVLFDRYENELRDTFATLRADCDDFNFKSVNDFVDAHSEDELIEVCELDADEIEAALCTEGDI